MGTRLYPCTTDQAKLERLARVSWGTARLLPFKEELRKSFLKMREGASFTDEDGYEGPVDVEYEFHSMFYKSDLESYEDFKLFGWGKFDLDLVPEDQDRYGGSTTDKELMRNMLLSSHWDEMPCEPDDPSLTEVIELSEGFHWV